MPREKLLNLGVHSLSDYEILCVLLEKGNANYSVFDVAQSIFTASNGKIGKMVSWKLEDYLEIPGLGPSKASAFMATFELLNRLKQTDCSQGVKIENSQHAYQLICHKLLDLVHEECWVLFLNTANCVIESKRISKGGIQQTVVDHRLVLRFALERSSTGIIMIHNHPSGQIDPSEHDHKLTKKMVKACAFMNIKFLDHLIVGREKYYSFADNGNL